MRIDVKVEVSYTTSHHKFYLDDLGVTKEEWEKLTADQKKEKIQDACYELPESPSWIVDTWSETE